MKRKSLSSKIESESSKKDKQQNKEKYKKRHPGVQDSIKSTILILNNHQSIIEEIDSFGLSQQKQKKLLFHPIMVVVLHDKKLPRTFYAFVEGLLYERESFLHCISTYMQLFWVFSCFYPKEGSRVCQFIQQLFFNLKADDTELTTKINDLKELKDQGTVQEIN